LRTLFLLLALLSAGCATAGNPAVRDQTLLDQIQVGTSTKDDVRRLMGWPSVSAVIHGAGQYHETWKYAYARHDSNPFIYVPLIGPLVLMINGAGKTESASFSIYFDQAGIVRGLTKDNMDLNLGGIVTPTSLILRSEAKGESADAEQHPVRFHNNIQIHAQ
jgi:outer membrane protein assembly factor BamE (lipoprotein component of BamABCDE complex)